MNKKTVITLIIILVLVLAGLGLIYWFWSNQQTAPTDNQLTDTVVTDDSKDKGGTLKLDDDDQKKDEVDVVKPQNAALISATRYFVERWGSYSNMSNYQNVRDLKPVMTDDFYNEAMSKSTEIAYDEIANIKYEGFEARVMSIDWEYQGESEATAVVTTNRRHLLDDQVETYPQDIRVNLIKQGNAWIVAQAVWMDK